MRNDYIADLAAAFAGGEWEALKVFGFSALHDNGAGTADVDTNNGADAVSVLVESTEHGRELIKRLPGWDQIHDAPAPEGQPFKPMTNPFKSRPLHKTVITFAAAAKMETIDAEVLIYASGEWAPTLRGFPPRSQKTPKEVVLIDIADNFDRDAVNAARRRLQAYEGRGWKVINYEAAE